MRNSNAWNSIIILFFILMSGCSSQPEKLISGPISQDQTNLPLKITATAAVPAQTSTSSVTPTPAPAYTMKVMTYNIELGGRFDTRLPEAEMKDNSIDGILAFLAVENLDVIGLQELNGWEMGQPNLLDKVANDLNMQGYLALDPDGFHNGLLTKYEILKVENLGAMMYGPAIYARLNAPFGPLNVFNVHLMAFEPATRLCQEQKLLKLAEKYKNEPTILMGDFNGFPDYGVYGWNNVVDWGVRGIDQIWVSPVFQATYEISKTSPVQRNDGTDVYAGKPLRLLSDHMPVTRIFNIQSLDGTASAQAKPYPSSVMDLQSPISPLLSNASLLDGGPIDHCFSNMAWSLDKTTANINDQLVLKGVGDWSTGFGYRMPIQPGEGLLTSFTYTGNPDEFVIMLQHGEWQQADYRRFGVYVAGDQIAKDVWEGPAQIETSRLPGIQQIQPNHPYGLFLGVAKDNRLVTIFWDKENPGRLSIVNDNFGEKWQNLDWDFFVNANSGEIDVQDAYLYSFDGVKQ